MSERDTRPTSDMSWAEGASPHGITEPTASREAGYFEGTAPSHADADLLPAEHENWRWQEDGRWLAYLDAVLVRRFESVAEGIETKTDPADKFETYSADGVAQAGASLWAVHATGVPYRDLTALAIDGQRAIVVVDLTTGYGASYLINLASGSAVSGFTTSLNRKLPCVVAADGQYFYLASSDGTADRVDVVDRTTGASVATLQSHGSYGATLIASNGSKLVFVDTNDATRLQVYTVGTWAYDGYYDAGSEAINGLCIGADDAFIEVDDAGDGHCIFHAITLSTRALNWSYSPDPIWVADGPDVNGMATDGEFLYVATARNQVGASAYGSVHCFELQVPGYLWSLDLDGAADCDHVAVDQRRIFATRGSTAEIWDKVTRQRVGIAATNAVSDGDAAISFYTDTLYKHFLGGPGREFVRVAGTTTYRRPFFHLAIPTGDR